MKPIALVIENDGSTRRLLDVLLTRSGLEVDLAPTGSDGLLLLESVRYDVVLIDLLLPGASGTQLLGWIERERPRTLPRCVVLSSAPERQLHDVRERWPDVRVIRKPFDLEDIIEAAQGVTREVDRVPSPAEEFVRRSVRAGAKGGVLVKLTGAQIELVDAFGYNPAETESYFPLALDAPMPLCAAIRNARPVWLASLTMATAEYPLLAPVFEKNESRAIAVVPLMRDAKAVGAVGWTFREPRQFGDAEREIFTAIATALVEGLPDGPPQSVSLAGA